MACGPTRWFGCSVDAVVSCGVNDGEFDCLRETVERRAVDVGFLRKVAMGWDAFPRPQSWRRINRSGLVLACVGFGRAKSVRLVVGRSVVDNATVD